MQTRKLHQAYKETNKLVDFLVPRDWYSSPELVAILERADSDVSKIVDEAISQVLSKLEGSYVEEAETWAKNTMTNLEGKRLSISKAEQSKARTDANKIKRTALKLRSL